MGNGTVRVSDNAGVTRPLSGQGRDAWARWVFPADDSPTSALAIGIIWSVVVIAACLVLAATSTAGGRAWLAALLLLPVAAMAYAAARDVRCLLARRATPRA